MLLALRCISMAVLLHNIVTITIVPQQPRVMLQEQTGLKPTNTFQLVKLPDTEKMFTIEQRKPLLNTIKIPAQVGQPEKFIPPIIFPYTHRPISFAGKMSKKRNNRQIAHYIVNRFRKQQDQRWIGLRYKVYYQINFFFLM